MTEEEKKLAKLLKFECDVEREVFAFLGTGDDDGVTGTANVLRAVQLMHKEYMRLRAKEANAQHWKANHDNVVAKCALLSQRDDLPVDRLPAYRELERLQKENACLVEKLNCVKT